MHYTKAFIHQRVRIPRTFDQARINIKGKNKSIMSKKRSTKNSVIVILLAGVLYWGFHIFQNGMPQVIPDNDTITASNLNNLMPEITGSTSIQKGLELPLDLQRRPSRMLSHTGYTVSFNSHYNLANWSAWVLTKTRTEGSNKRDNYGFAPDPLLPESQAAVTQDYSGSGYDRGHMCPAGDNKWNATAMKECFYLSNICPQKPNLNRGDWKELEDLCRDWARSGYTLYIACGPLFTSASPAHIGKQHKIAVPDGFFKVILRQKGNRQEALGFLYKNGNQNMPVSDHATSVDEVEKLSGFDFFSKLPDSIEKKIESKRNPSDWNL